jgi:signal transduction histidine kinase
MSRMLNDLLDYALLHADAGQIEKVDVKTLVEDAADLVLQRDGFKLEIDGTFPVMHADPTPLSLVFRNLIGNAVKHHDKDQGAIRVAASNEDGFVRFSISDDGPGIPEKFRAVIFDFFKSLSPNPTHERAGMGLTFVKKVIAKHGGEVTVAGNPGGRGSCFSFTWPLTGKDKIKTAAGPKRGARKTAARKSARRCD